MSIKSSYLRKQKISLNKRDGLNEKVQTKKSTLGGSGLFAKKNLNKGEIVHFHSKPYPQIFVKDLQKWPVKRREIFLHYAFQGGEDYYCGDEKLFKKDRSFLMNHSCSPNCWFKGNNCLVASKKIIAGEELTMDYATFMTSKSLERPFVCNCKTKTCRKLIRNDDCLLPSIQKFYKGHFLSHVSKFIKSHVVGKKKK